MFLFVTLYKTVNGPFPVVLLQSAAQCFVDSFMSQSEKPLVEQTIDCTAIATQASHFYFISKKKTELDHRSRQHDVYSTSGAVGQDRALLTARETKGSVTFSRADFMDIICP